MTVPDPGERARAVARRTSQSLPMRDARRRRRTLISGVVTAAVVVAFLVVLRPWEVAGSATPDGFVRVDVGTRSSLAIPEDWTVVESEDDIVQVRAEAADGSGEVDVLLYGGPLNPSSSDLRAELDRDLTDAGHPPPDAERFAHPGGDLDLACRGPVLIDDASVMAICYWPFADRRFLAVQAVGIPDAYDELALIAASLEYT